MKFTYLKTVLVSLAIGCFASATSLAHERETHQQMSENAANASTNLIAQLPNLGLSSLSDELKQGDQTLNIIKWIRLGAFKEDDTRSEAFARYRHHFYDPISKQGFGGLLFRNSGLIYGMPSPDWALVKGPADRDSNLGLVFCTMGHLAHLVQDAAQQQFNVRTS